MTTATCSARRSSRSVVSSASGMPGGNGCSHGSDQFPPTSFDGGLLTWREDSAAHALVALADARAISVDIVSQPLRKLLQSPSGRRFGIGWFGQRDPWPIRDPLGAVVPKPTSDLCWVRPLGRGDYRRPFPQSMFWRRL